MSNFIQFFQENKILCVVLAIFGLIAVLSFLGVKTLIAFAIGAVCAHSVPFIRRIVEKVLS